MRILVAVLSISALVAVACSGEASGPRSASLAGSDSLTPTTAAAVSADSTDASDLVRATSVPSRAVPTVTPTPAPTPTPPPPSVVVTLRQVTIGTGLDYEQVLGVPVGGLSDLRLLIRITNGQQTIVMVFPPQGANALQIVPDTPIQIDKRIFSAPEVDTAFTLEINGMEEDDTSWIAPATQAAAAASVFTGGVTGIAAALAPTALKVLGVDSQSVGFFQERWTSLEDWGAGRYIDVGSDDLRLWFDVTISGIEAGEIVGRTAVPTPTTAPTATPQPTSTPLPSPTPTTTPVPIASATPTPMPSVVQVAWLNSDGVAIEEVARGSTVTLFAQFAGLPDSLIDIAIYEADPGAPDDLVVTGQMRITAGVGTALWETVWMQDGLFGIGGDPEYKFIVLGIDSPLLTVM